MASSTPVLAQATLLPNPELCFSALAPTSGGPGNTGTGFIGLLGPITGGTGGTSGTYGGVALTGGSGTNATANITVSGGAVTQVAILNPGINYVVGDVLSATPANIGNVSGFSVGVSSLSINYSLAGGSASFYIPNTLTPKQTWQNAGETILNQNPVALDQNGCAIVYGAGIYRLILKDALGNTVFDQLTASTGPSGIFWAGTAGGTGNAITVTDSAFALQDGATIQFRAFASNSGPTTVSVSAGTPIAIVKDTSSGPSALSGGEIGIGNTPMITYDLPNNEFHIVNPSATTSTVTNSSLITPQGYLNLVGQASGDVIQTADVIGSSTLYYSPLFGSIVPIFNGTVFVNTQISELTMTLTSAGSPSNTIQDACVFSNNGVPTLVLGPSWTTATAGAGARGTGPGTPQLTKLQGLWVNAVAITAYNGLSSYSVPASQCTYLGSVAIDASAGQVSAYVTYGQSRKFGVYNAYNRRPIVMKAGDSTASWGYNTNTTRAANNSSANSITILQGLAEDQCYASEIQKVEISSTSFSGVSSYSYNGQSEILIGINSTTSGSGTFSSTALGASFAPSGGTLNFNTQTFGQNTASLTIQPFIGINAINALENTLAATSAGTTYFGTEPNMLLTTNCRG